MRKLNAWKARFCLRMHLQIGNGKGTRMAVDRAYVGGGSRDGWPSDRSMVARSRRVLVDHYVRRDIDSMMAPMADDMTWIGPLSCQHARSAAEMRSLVEPEYGNRVELVDEHWGIRTVGATCVVVATYGAFVPDSTASEVEFRQSATFVWGLSPEGPRIVHLHISNAYDVPPRVERTSVPGEDPIDYAVVSVTASRSEGHDPIRFDEPGGRARFIAEDRIVCLDAAEEGCVVVHDGGSFAGRERLSSIEQKLPPCFVRTHRSCVVNAHRVESMWRYRVEFDDGSTRPIAERRYLDVVESIEKFAGRRIERS
ncbi:hypothetical protein GJG86_04450 [Eggerthella sp. HF-4214]|uniref:HTH LytTR-type domain-containing protein n=2 Tax=Eggerthella guodeyinii TaxID=2690837 RepID=A0A6N7RLE7_9ACTN|nr:hypothetical protein [Eggerthella guodeyinii]